MMNPQGREQARIAVLRYLDAAADGAPGRGIPTALLQQYLRADGFEADRAATEAILVYLEGAGLAESRAKVISPENKIWRITKAGRDEYASLCA